MSLDQSVLSDELNKIFSGQGGYPATAQAAGQAWAAAYKEYAKTAASCGSAGAPSVEVDARAAVLSSSLGSAFASGTPAAIASGWVSGLTAYWSGMVFPGATPGVAAPPTIVGTLTASLPALWVASIAAKSNAADAAAQHAALFHAVTQTVIVTHAPPSACAGPLL